MDDEEYAIVSKKEFLTLKKEIERLKKNPLEGSESGENLQSSIDNLNRSLNVMLEVFKQAADDMKIEEHEAETVGKQITPLGDKLDTLIDQNQKIAKGIVAIADMVKERLDEITEKVESKSKLPPLSGGPAPKPAAQSSRPSYAMPPQPQAPPPQFSQPSQLQPPSDFPAEPNFGNLPPLGGNEGFDSGFGDLPPLTPPGAPPAYPPNMQQRKNIMGGLMK